MSTNDRDDLDELLRQQTALARFGELALKSTDLDEILTEACRLIGDALRTDLAKVMELQDDGQTLLVRAGVGWKPGIVGQVSVKAADHTSEGHALKTGKPMISTNIAEETRFEYPWFLVDNGVKAVANVVIIGGTDRPPFGILQIDSREPRNFTEGDTVFLTSYANLLAAAVERLRAAGELHDGEARLRASTDRQQAALETGLFGFFEWDVQKAVITADKHFAGFYGLDPARVAKGVPISDVMVLIHPDDRAEVGSNVEKALADGSDYEKEFRLNLEGGVRRWMLVRGHCTQRDEAGRPLLYTGTAVDVTGPKSAEVELRRANEALEERVAGRTRDLMEANTRLRTEAEERERVEEQLRQSHKMEAVGQLTGGIAHDFNNLLAGISGSLELMRARAAQGRTAELGRYIDVALASTNRAAALTHRLLAFSRRQTLDPRPTDANRLVADMEDLLHRTTGPAIRVETRLAAELWRTLCDPNQLESALLNLAINARDAMPDGGSLATETATYSPGGTVADSGSGMSPDVLEHAFDPFFTTKPTGQGTGLGLSMIYGFVQQSGGHVRLRSARGRGTTATLYLPRHCGPVEGEATQISVLRQTASDGAVVLAVEDEPAVRMIVTDVLTELGYEVLEAEDGRSGLTIVESDSRIDLLLTDVGLPGGMNGRQLADAARARRPGLKVLLVTGYAEATALENCPLGDGMEVMTKPFAVDALAARVKGIVEG